MADSWVTTHDARPFNDRVVNLKGEKQAECNAHSSPSDIRRAWSLAQIMNIVLCLL